MVGSNFVSRVVSGLIIGTVSLFFIIKGEIYLNCLLAIALFIMLLEWRRMNKSRGTVLYHIGNIYISIPMVFWMLCKTKSDELLYILLIVCSVDIFAYLGGTILKGPRIFPKISPGKTWSGTIAGCFAAIVISHFFTKFSIAISFSLVVSAVLGDLLESKAKRYLDVKDSGHIIPGHGGVCDRLDSFLLATYFYMMCVAFGFT